MKDFFISYNSADGRWAEWIAWVLEEHGYRVIIQAWDFRPGGNFVLDMQRATAEAERTVMVLSDAYLNALYTQPEWAAAFKQDPTARDLKLLPIRVALCQPTGMLAPLVYVDLVGKPESEAEQLLLAALKARAKPTTRPTFPQSERVRPAPVAFPGPVQTLPFPRNPFFTGREDLLEAIHTTLSSRGRVALSGLGGVGKTQIALEYVYRRQSDYEYVFWIRAEQKEELISGYVALAKALQIPGCQQADQPTVVNLMKQWLTTHERWLLVLDNADDLRQVRSFLPTASGHILMTTRAQAQGDIAQPLAVNQMAVDEGALFLLRRDRVIADGTVLSAASETDQDLARTLTAEMDGLPLALDQAGAYIEEQMLSLEEYLELFQTEKAELLKERGQLDPDHPSVTVTFTLAFEKVAAANAISADLVRVCAFLSPDAIPEEIFSDGVKGLGEPLSRLADSKLALTKAIAEAARFSLISRNPQTKTLAIHRLVQEVLRGEMDRESQKNWADKVVQAVTEVFPDAYYKNWAQCDRLLPHSQTVAQWIEAYGCESAATARLLNETANYLTGWKRYSEAEPLYQKALGMKKRLLGDEHPGVALSLNNLAQLYFFQERYSEAEPLCVEALGMYKRLLGGEHLYVARSLNNLAQLYEAQKLYREAEALLVEALGMKKRLLGSEHSSVADSLYNLAAFYKLQCRYSEAELLYQEALGMRKRLLGDEHPSVALSLNNLAQLYEAQKCYSEVEPFYQEALSIAEHQLGEKHPYTVTIRQNFESFRNQQTE